MTNCYNLKDGLENLPNNLRHLIMGGTAIKSLPESIWKLNCLETIYLYDCKNLRNIPGILNHKEESSESVQNQTALKCLDLSGCQKIVFLPIDLCKLLHLQKLILAGCSSLEELPLLPHGLSKLNIEKCERLKYIAELSSSLSRLFVNDCTSLETVSSWGSRTKPPFHDRSCRYLFMNCLKLDDETRNKVIADRARLLSLSGQDDAGYFHRIIYPGDEIPEWFNCQTDGGNSINVHLPPNWFELPLRFVFCMVFYSYNHDGYQHLDIEYEFNFKTNNSNSDGCLYNYGDRFDCSFSGTNSDHVYLVSTPLSTSDKNLSEAFGPNWYSICSNITEASFRVSFMESVHTIKKFGFRFCNADYGFEELNVDRASSNQPSGHQEWRLTSSQ